MEACVERRLIVRQTGDQMHRLVVEVEHQAAIAAKADPGVTTEPGIERREWAVESDALRRAAERGGGFHHATPQEPGRGRGNRKANHVPSGGPDLLAAAVSTEANVAIMVMLSKRGLRSDCAARDLLNPVTRP